MGASTVTEDAFHLAELVSQRNHHLQFHEYPCTNLGKWLFPLKWSIPRILFENYNLGQKCCCVAPKIQP